MLHASFLENVSHFRELNSVPVGFGADTTVDEMILNHAQWHRSCHAEFARARKRKTPIKKLHSKTKEIRRIQEGKDCRARAAATPAC